MNNAFDKNNFIVKKILEQNNLECPIFTFPEGTKTALDAANAIGCEVAQIAKSIIFKKLETNEIVLLIVSGKNKVCEKKVSTFLGKQIVKAEPELIKNTTGFVIGGVPPIGHKQKIENILFDEDLLHFENVWTSAGTAQTVFNIKTQDLITITNSKIISIKL